MLQKQRLNTHRKKPFKKLVAELATVEDHRCGTELVVSTPLTDGDGVLSSKLINQNRNCVKNTATDCNGNVAKLSGTSPTWQ